MKGLLLELARGTVGTEVGTERSRQVGAIEDTELLRQDGLTGWLGELVGDTVGI